MGRKRKLRFRISLDDLDTPEISLKELADSHGVSEGPSDGDALQASPSKDPYHEWHDRPHNILSQLEAKYSTHCKVKDPKPRPVKETPEVGEGGEPVKKKRNRRHADEEYYDLDDPFIDDSELMEVFERQEEAEATVTKYHGFFVNHGDLEVSMSVVRDDSLGGKEPKKRQRKKAAGGEGVNDDETWLQSDDIRAALGVFKDAVATWRSVQPGEIPQMKELPNDLHAAATQLDVVVRGKGRILTIGDHYFRMLRDAFPLTKPQWKRAMKTLMAQRVLSLKAKLDQGIATLKLLYTQRRDAMLSNSKHSMQPPGSPLLTQGGTPILSKEVPLDGALRQSLCEILDDVKVYWMAKSIQLLSQGKQASSQEDEETEVLNQIANLWPVGTMKVQRLKKVYSDHLINQGGAREEFTMPPPAPVTQPSGRESTTPSVSSVDSKPAGEKKKRERKSKASENGDAPKKRQRKSSTGTVKDENAAGGKAGPASTASAPAKTPTAAPVVKRVVKPSGPVFGKIGPLSKQYDPKDFEAVVNP